MEVSKNNGNKKLRKDFDSWKQVAEGKITQNELYNWMIANK